LAISAAILLQNIANIVRVLEFRQRFVFLLQIASATEQLKINKADNPLQQ